MKIVVGGSLKTALKNKKIVGVDITPANCSRVKFHGTLIMEDGSVVLFTDLSKNIKVKN